MGTTTLRRQQVQLAPLQIAIGGINGKKYKSIGEITWDGIPPLAILTGPNGSGKTQLLEVLAYRLTNTPHGEIDQLNVRVSGDGITPQDVAYLPNPEAMNNGGIALGHLTNERNNVYQQLRQGSHDMSTQILRARLQNIFGETNLNTLSQEQFNSRIPDDFFYLIDESNIVHGMCRVFLAHRLRTFQEFENHTPEDKIAEKIGIAPWDAINDAFKAADFEYRLVSPIGTDVLDSYQFQLKSTLTDRPINPSDLSSGEKIILRVMLWLFRSKHDNTFPKLLLLDEPDAHLHPSMTRQFMSVLKDVLVDQFGIRVIMTTHSPSTIALAPEGAVFEMAREQPRIRPSACREDTIGLLTAGLVIVTAGTRFVLVEDEGDVDFYGVVRDILTNQGPSKIARSIKPVPSLVFLPASRGEGRDRIGGGKSAVTLWVDKLKDPPLGQMFRGIIDQDLGGAGTERVFVIGRHSIENYLVDPIVVFALLNDAGVAPTVPGCIIAQGDEHLVRELPQEMLQSIVDTICEAVKLKVGAQADAMKEVVFTSGLALKYPAWTVDCRGHNLLQTYQDTFGGPKLVSPPRLKAMMRRVRLMPVELADIMHGLQQ